METRANYVLIGLFTVLGVVGAIAVFLAFARVELNRQFAYYTINFSSVAGLAEASDVRFAGLPVGQVVDVALSPELDGLISVLIEVDANTPVRTDSVATVESQGVTGVGFVAISAGNPSSELALAEPGGMGEIQSGRSVIQSLSEDAPALVTETLLLVRDVGDLFSGANRDRIEQIIINSEEASASFAQTLEDFAAVSGSVENFVTQIDRFNSVLQTVVADFDTVLITADETVASWGALAADAEAFLNAGEETFDATSTTVERANTFIDQELVTAADELTQTITALRSEIGALTDDARAMVATFSQTGDLANTRLSEVGVTIDALDALIANTDIAIASVDTAATDFSALITGDSQLLVTETRAVMATTQRTVEAILLAAEERLPAVLDDVERTAATIAEATAAITEELTGAATGMGGVLANANAALLAATETFAGADATLRVINSALASGEDTLLAATGAFSAAEGAIATDLQTFIARLDTTLNGLDVAIAQVAADLPGISDSLSEASSAAEVAFEGVARAVNSASPAIQDFAASGLPEYAQFAREARALAASLDRLVRQIERDPGRFFLGSDTPEFRR